MFSKPAKLFFLLLPLLLLVACGGNSISFQDGGVAVSVELSEEQIRTMATNGNFNVNNEDLFTNVSDVNFSDGVIRMEGTYETPSGSSGEGFVDLAFSAVNGRLNVEIVDHNLDGLSDRIDEANRAFSDAFAQQASQEDNVRFTEVSVTDDALTMQIQVSFE